jgi:hypothetical protein
MQFSVPQFIEFESKIVGPLSLRQFAFIAIPALVSFVLFFVVILPIWIVIAIVLMSAGVSFAFIKVAGRPLYAVFLYALKFFWQPKILLWKSPIIQESVAVPSVQRQRQQLKDIIPDFSKIGKLWQDITTSKQPIPQREKHIPQASIKDLHEQYQVFRKITGEKEVARRIDYR